MTLTRKPKLQHIVVVGMSTMRVKGRLEGIHTEWNIDTGDKRMFVSNETFGSILGKKHSRSCKCHVRCSGWTNS